MANEKGAEVARAYVLIVPSLQGAQKSITDELVPGAEEAGKEAGEKGGHHLREGFAKAAKLAATATVAAMAAATALVKQSLDAWAETEQLAGGIEKLFGGDAAQKVMENAAQAYKTAGMSANQYMQSVTGISAALLKSGVSAEEAAQLADDAMRAMADNANTFGTKTTEELAGVYAALARQSYAVLDQLNLGYGGTKAGMEALIADANAYAKATGRAADLSIDNFGDVVTAIGLIQEKIGISETTVKEAEGTISGSLGMLSAAWENLVAGFGDPAADVDALVDSVMRSLESVVNNVLPAVTRIANALVRALPNLVRQIAEFLPSVFPAVLEAVTGLATAIADELPGLIDLLLQVILDNAGLLIDTVLDVALALVNAVPKILDTLAPAIPQIVGDVVASLIEHIPDFVQGAIDIVAGIILDLPKILEALINEIPHIIDTLKTTFTDKENIQKFIDAGVTLGAALVKGIADYLTPRGFTLDGGSVVPSDMAMLQMAATGTSTAGMFGLGDSFTIGTVNVAADSQSTVNSLTAAAVKQARIMAGRN